MEGRKNARMTGSVSVHTVNTTHLLRRSRTGDAEDPWESVGSERVKHDGAWGDGVKESWGAVAEGDGGKKAENEMAVTEVECETLGRRRKT